VFDQERRRLRRRHRRGRRVQRFPPPQVRRRPRRAGTHQADDDVRVEERDPGPARVTNDEAARADGLLHAQSRAAALFEAVESECVVKAGMTEQDASDAIAALAAERFGCTRHWHKKIVRTGPNTLEPYSVDPPDRVIDDGDIVFGDFGPVFDGW